MSVSPSELGGALPLPRDCGLLSLGGAQDAHPRRAGFKGSPHSNPIHSASNLAHREEGEVANGLGDAWRVYAARTPRWFPRFGVPASGEARAGGKGMGV
jgi:hypothetical protein